MDAKQMKKRMAGERRMRTRVGVMEEVGVFSTHLCLIPCWRRSGLHCDGEEEEHEGDKR